MKIAQIVAILVCTLHMFSFASVVAGADPAQESLNASPPDVPLNGEEEPVHTPARRGTIHEAPGHGVDTGQEAGEMYLARIAELQSVLRETYDQVVEEESFDGSYRQWLSEASRDSESPGYMLLRDLESQFDGLAQISRPRASAHDSQKGIDRAERSVHKKSEFDELHGQLVTMLADFRQDKDSLTASERNRRIREMHEIQRAMQDLTPRSGETHDDQEDFSGE